MLLRARLDQAFASTRDGDLHLAVLMLDLDRFKEVNDTRSGASPAGDSLLRAVDDALAVSAAGNDVDCPAGRR
ncbi:diguanylate cyclase domain-containing protein [Bradyrhizobium betae]